MRTAVLAAVVAAGAACAHAGIRSVSECQQVQGEERLECGACTAQNEAQGWLGTWEYRPGEPAGARCRRVK